jgi:hypothetical protein
VHHLSAFEAFLYLVLFTALGTSAFSVVELFFNLIEYRFYDPADPPATTREAWLSGVRWAVARVVIAFPVFLFASWWTARALRREPVERSSPIRRWLTYFAMFLTVCVIIGDFVTLVAYVLAGETTMRFFLKVVVVAAVAGIILGYYLWDMRETARKRSAAPSYAILAVAIAVTLFAVGSGLTLIGAPSEQAALRTDARRVRELRAIANAVDVFFERNASLPESLEALSTALGPRLAAVDPETGASYEYRPGADRTFELCATFARPSENVSDSIWTHGAGAQCFTLTAGDEKRR